MITKDLVKYLQSNINGYKIYDSFGVKNQEKSIIVQRDDTDNTITDSCVDYETITFTMLITHNMSTSESESAALAVKNFLKKKSGILIENGQHFNISKIRGPIRIGADEQGNHQFAIDFKTIVY